MRSQLVIIIFMFVFTDFATRTPAELSNSTLELYNRAPDTLPGTVPEMRDPLYWIENMDKPDDVILTLDEIQSMNEEYQKKIRLPDPFKSDPEEWKSTVRYYWPGHVVYVPDFQGINQKAIADTVRKRIRDEIIYLRSRDYGNFLAVKYSDKEIDGFENEMAIDLVKDKITLQYGITVRYTRLRNVPSFFPEQVGVTEAGKLRWDQWNMYALELYMPVTVLHVSKSGEYLFVLCEMGYGWVRSEDIAFGDKRKIDTFANPEDFVICTGNRVQFYSDEDCTYSSGWFKMGDRIPLASKSDPRKISVPVRKTDGTFITELAWLAKDADVHVGFLPYIRRNIIVTALKLLDTPYDWSGACFGSHHHGIHRRIFACFGFDLPLDNALSPAYGNNRDFVNPEIGKKEQYRAILEHEPFVTIISCGVQCQLLLGEYQGVPIVFDVHGYGYEENGNFLEVRRCSISDMRLPRYFLKRNITFLELK